MKKKRNTMSTSVHIASFNVCLSVGPPLRFNGAGPRSIRLADSFYSTLGTKIDIIALQELITGRDTVIKNFVHHPYSTPIMQTSFMSNNVKLGSSGLCLLSKYPILASGEYFFEGGAYHLEKFLSKGCLYIKVRIPSVGIVNVVNVHLNAWTNIEAVNARIVQSQQIGHYMRYHMRVPMEEALFVCGDFNVDVYEHRGLVNVICANMGVVPLLPKETSFTFDPLRNSLVGTDDPLEYATITKQYGCYDSFLKTGICECCPQQLLDLITISSLHRQAMRQESRVVPIRTRVDFPVAIDILSFRQTNEISDHFAIVLEVMFDGNIVDMYDRITPYTYGSSTSPLWLLVFCVVLVIYIYIVHRCLQVVVSKIKHG